MRLATSMIPARPGSGATANSRFLLRKDQKNIRADPGRVLRGDISSSEPRCADDGHLCLAASDVR
jgi:hypothetical protein